MKKNRNKKGKGIKMKNREKWIEIKLEKEEVLKWEIWRIEMKKRK